MGWTDRLRAGGARRAHVRALRHQIAQTDTSARDGDYRRAAEALEHRALLREVLARVEGRPAMPEPGRSRRRGVGGANTPEWFPMDVKELALRLPADALGVWAWYAGDLLEDDDSVTAWDFYTTQSWLEGAGDGCEDSAPITSGTPSLRARAGQLLAEPRVELVPRTYAVRTSGGRHSGPWHVLPALVAVRGGPGLADDRAPLGSAADPPTTTHPRDS